MILNNAKQIYLGETPVSKIYKGSSLVWSDSDLPSGYTKVAYLEAETSDGWFDTGIVPEGDIQLETRLYLTTCATDYFCAVRKSSSSSTRYYLLNLYYNSGFVVGKSTITAVSSSIAIFKESMLGQYFDIKTNINTSRVRVTVNGRSVNTNTSAAITTRTPLPLFALMENDALKYTSPVGTRCCYAKFTKNDEVVRDLIPCLDKNRVACFYDKVTGETLYSKAGAFNYGLAE